MTEQPLEKPSEGKTEVEKPSDLKTKILELLAKGEKPENIAQQLGCSKQYVYKVRAKQKWELERAKPSFEVEKEELKEIEEEEEEIPEEEEEVEEVEEVELPSKEEVRKIISSTFNIIFHHLDVEELDSMEEDILTDAYYPIFEKYFKTVTKYPELWCIAVTLLVILPRLGKGKLKLEVVHRFKFWERKKSEEEAKE
jgi:transcriptional regulator